MKLFSTTFRSIPALTLIIKQKPLSSSLSKAWFYRSQYFYNISRLRPYCTRFERWPSDLPPATDWGYEKPGPETWPSKYPTAGGKKQSPVDIVTSLVKPAEFEAPLRWQYSPGGYKSIINNGCGWRVDVDGTNTDLSGGPLSNSYKLSQFHCHWGDCSSVGSEHSVDGKAFSGELHFVHWNHDEYPSIVEALSSPNGLTVIGVLLEVGEENPEINKICEALASIPMRDNRVNLEADINPVLMYPADKAYWTYSGSLTTPPCYESVTWLMFKNPITVSEEQLNHFRQMKKSSPENGENCGCVIKNYRPPQSLNEREIFEAAC